MESFESNFQKVVGGTEEQQEEVGQELTNEYQTSHTERYKDFELEKTENEERLITIALSCANEIVERYQGKPLKYSKEKIHVLESGSIAKRSKGKIREAEFDSDSDIGIDRKNSNLGFTLILIHELLHIAGYHSMQIKDNGEVVPYRQGLSVTGRGTEEDYRTQYFYDFEEAVIEKVIAQQYLNIVSQDSSFGEELKTLKEFKDLILEIFVSQGAKKEVIENLLNTVVAIDTNDLPRVINLLKGNDPAFNAQIDAEYEKRKGSSSRESIAQISRYGYIAGYIKSMKDDIIRAARPEEQKKLDLFIEDIYVKSNGKYSKEEIFRKLADAHFTGKLLPLARMIEEVFGKGAFRGVGEQTKRIIGENKNVK